MFAKSAQVSNRGCSLPLQRVVTDFGADQPFAQAMDKIVEHYGVVLGESTIARITQGHAKRIFETAPPPKDWPTQGGTKTAVIVEIDGGMVPIVKTDPTQAGKRKGKTLQWEEAKICLAHPQGSKTLAFGGTLQGSVDTAGQCLFDCAVQAGFDYLSAAGKAIASTEQEQKVWMDEHKARLKANWDLRKSELSIFAPASRAPCRSRPTSFMREKSQLD